MIDRPKYLTDDELADLLRSARERRHKNAPRDHAFLSLLANTGLRPGEAVRLLIADVHFCEQPWLRVRRLKKRGRAVLDDLPLAPKLAAVLRSYTKRIRVSPWLFPANSRGESRRIGVRTAERIMACYAARAGIPGRPKLYALRHTAGRRLYAASLDLRLVQRILGHASSRTTEIYAHLAPNAQRDLFARLGVVT